VDQQNLRRKNDELAQALKEKNKRFLQVQELYDKLKRKAMMGQMQDAAEHAVDSSIHGVAGIGGDSALDNDGAHSGIYQESGYPYRQSYNSTNDTNRVNNMYSGQSSTQTRPDAWAKTVGGAQGAWPNIDRWKITDCLSS
jgi:E3 ubiquitin-protein ligase CCNP1IP1